MDLTKKIASKVSFAVFIYLCCDNYGVLLKIIERRLGPYTKNIVGEYQAGFEREKLMIGNTALIPIKFLLTSNRYSSHGTVENIVKI